MSMRTPVSIGDQDQRAQRLREQHERQAQRSDALYVAGAAFVSVGVGFYSWKISLVVVGMFCLLPPVLELASGFLKGMRYTPRR